MQYLDILVRLICGELVAAEQYKLAAESCVSGPDQDYLRTEFKDHYQDEMDHYTLLTNALMQRNGKIELNLHSILDNAIPKTTELTSNLATYLRKFFIESEKLAINAYIDFHRLIKDVDPELDDVILNIISQERDHKLDLVRIGVSSDDTDLEKLINRNSIMNEEDSILNMVKDKASRVKESMRRGITHNPADGMNLVIREIPINYRNNLEFMNKAKQLYRDTINKG